MATTSLLISVRPQTSQNCVAAVAFIKSRPAIIDSGRPISAQLQVMTVLCNSYEGLERTREDKEGVADFSAILAHLSQYTKQSFAPLIRAMRSHDSGEIEVCDVYDELFELLLLDYIPPLIIT